METIKDENGKEITVELVLVKNQTKSTDCDICIVGNSYGKNIGICSKCKGNSYFIINKLR